MALPVVRSVRGRDGQRYVDAEHPRGGTIRLPIEWTDRAPPVVPARLRGREVKVRAEDLLRLAKAVEAQRVDGGTVDAPAGGKREHPRSPRRYTAARQGSSGPSSGRMVEPERDHAEQLDRRVGHPRSQSPARRATARGGRT